MTMEVFLQAQGMEMHLCSIYPIHHRHGFLPKCLRCDLIPPSLFNHLLTENRRQVFSFMTASNGYFSL